MGGRPLRQVRASTARRPALITLPPHKVTRERGMWKSETWARWMTCTAQTSKQKKKRGKRLVFCIVQNLWKWREETDTVSVSWLGPAGYIHPAGWVPDTLPMSWNVFPDSSEAFTFLCVTCSKSSALLSLFSSPVISKKWPVKRKSTETLTKQQKTNN